MNVIDSNGLTRDAGGKPTHVSSSRSKVRNEGFAVAGPSSGLPATFSPQAGRRRLAASARAIPSPRSRERVRVRGR
ncbi:hypothetical protein CN233_05630 [Sinorhizobium meliloti]|nr:hypothetical protein CN233_05630 [Sinorhizobium meliloti]RVG53825.1 hypothetical protein CN226_10555 [Sinorhizobium meliloti]RVI02363.1 hypothetical protein CN205_26535 [Sinorhizobium meliloti]RVK87226.1 hypothetical protein CN152_33650 [Sinorhizobium meliloti]RVM52373.1 hypothetical protein CN127_10475 [Sinorhizobium meliloti]